MRKNLDKIDKKKRKNILAGLDLVEQVNHGEKIIERVIIFGSCVSNECKTYSDIDVCFVSDFDCSNKKYFKASSEFEIVTDSLCDIFNYKNVKGKLKEEIDQKGVVVYEY